VQSVACMAVGQLCGQPPRATPGLTTSWTIGTCDGCPTQASLSNIQFTAPKEAWATACSFPPPSSPSGQFTCTVVHTVNGGRTWKAIREVLQYPGNPDGPPALSFSSRPNGWISWCNAEGPHLIQTQNGGKNWAALPGEWPNDYPCAFFKIVFFDQKSGLGANRQRLFRTADGGRTWTQAPLSATSFVDRIYFLNSQVGWIADTLDKGVDVLRTTDGGQRWETSHVDRPLKSAQTFDLFFLNANRGWVVAGSTNEGGTALYDTLDGGRTWSPDPNVLLQDPEKPLASIRFTSATTGVALLATKAAGQLLYTIDAGQTWQSGGTLPYDMGLFPSCQVSAGCAVCGGNAGTDSVALLKACFRR
jgi:photosystem II stability/assembly factor-like uncharacterized protein